MTYVPANPQFLAPGETAPEGSPQTQYVVPSADGPEVVTAAAQVALTAYDGALAAHVEHIPPAGVYVGADVRWVPVDQALAPPAREA